MREAATYNGDLDPGWSTLVAFNWHVLPVSED
jgi:hypothetical protein